MCLLKGITGLVSENPSVVNLLNRYFDFGIFNARLEPILTNKLSKSFSVIVTPEFGEVVAFSFKVTVDFILFQVFLNLRNIFENSVDDIVF